MKNKKILLVFIPIILILAIGMILMVLYFTTDMFKDEATVFAKYFLQNEEIFDLIKNENIKEQNNFKANNTYTMAGELTTTVQNETNPQEIKAITKARHDINTGRTYSEIILKNGDIDTLKASYINSDDIYAVKCDEIVTNYIGFHNSELKKLAQNIGITNTDRIPDSIDLNAINHIDDITNEQKSHIIDTYSKVILDTISKDKYTKMGKTEITIESVNYETNAYQVVIDDVTLKQIVINCLTTLQNDNTTLAVISSKLSSLGISNQYTDITKLSEIVKNLAIKVQDMNMISSNITILVYESRGKTVRTELRIDTNEKEEIQSITNTTSPNTDIALTTENLTTNKITIDILKEGNINKVILNLEQNKIRSTTGLNETANTTQPTTKKSQIILEKDISDTNITNQITLIADMNNPAQSMEINTTVGKLENNTINSSSNVILNISYDGINAQTIQSSYTQNIQAVTEVEEIPQLKKSNTVIMNNYAKGQLVSFLTKVGAKISQVFPNKLAELGTDILANLNSANQNNNTTKLLEVVGTSGVSIANVNGIDISKIATISGIEIGIAMYTEMIELENISW